MLRSIVAATKPDIIIEVDGDHYTITTVTALKTINVSFTLGQEYETDPGTEKKTTVGITKCWTSNSSLGNGMSLTRKNLYVPQKHDYFSNRDF
jgi:hypothetical protein